MASSRRLTARGRERREELLAYATRRFAENGFHPTSVADIVDGVGVGKGVFYWYFPSKDDLLLEILRQALVGLRRCQHEALVGADDPLSRLESGIRASLRWSAANPDVIRLVMFARTEEHFARSLDKGRAIAIADTARHVEEAIQAGQIAPGDPALLASAIRGVTDELARSIALERAGTDDETVETAVRFCLRGLVGSPKER
jgi:AcrR family transcriptional regulator